MAVKRMLLVTVVLFATRSFAVDGVADAPPGVSRGIPASVKHHGRVSATATRSIGTLGVSIHKAGAVYDIRGRLNSAGKASFSPVIPR